MKTEQFRQLRAGEKEGDSAFETGHDTFGDKVHNGTRSEKPRQKTDYRDQYSCRCRKRRKACAVASGESAKGCTEQEGNGRGNGDRGVRRTAEEPKDQPAKQ